MRSHEVSTRMCIQFKGPILRSLSKTSSHNVKVVRGFKMLLIEQLQNSSIVESV